MYANTHTNIQGSIHICRGYIYVQDMKPGIHTYMYRDPYIYAWIPGYISVWIPGYISCICMYPTGIYKNPREKLDQNIIHTLYTYPVHICILYTYIYESLYPVHTHTHAHTHTHTHTYSR